MAVIVIWHTTDKGNDGKKDQDTKYRIACARYETDGNMKFITGEDLELWYRDKNQRNGTSRSGIWWSDTRSILQSSYRGDFWWVKK